MTHRAALIPVLEAATRRWRTCDLLAALEAHNVPAGPVNRIDQAFADPQVEARAMRFTATGDGGEPLPALAAPIRIDGVRVGSADGSPRLDAHAGATWRPRAG